MANTYGLNGYVYEVTPKGSDFDVQVWQPDFPKNKASKTVKGSDLDGKTWEERGVMEEILAPLWKELDDVRHKRERDQEAKDLKERQERESRELEARNDYLANTVEQGDRENYSDKVQDHSKASTTAKKK